MIPYRSLFRYGTLFFLSAWYAKNLQNTIQHCFKNKKIYVLSKFVLPENFSLYSLMFLMFLVNNSLLATCSSQALKLYLYQKLQPLPQKPKIFREIFGRQLLHCACSHFHFIKVSFFFLLHPVHPQLTKLQLSESLNIDYLNY